MPSRPLESLRPEERFDRGRGSGRVSFSEHISSISMKMIAIAVVPIACAVLTAFLQWRMKGTGSQYLEDLAPAAALE